ncbi:MAG: signal peptide peptidase SppA [Cardiobacteriaceae bacterium]|nr:signal peptide peptidase SppA [Cardiobacteriaceae bacterium]
MTEQEKSALASALVELRKELKAYRNRHWLRNLLIIGVLVLMVFNVMGRGMYNPTQEQVAIIDVQGVIADDQLANSADIIRGLKQASDNPQVVAIVLNINSPGGSPVQSAQVYRAIKALKKERGNLPIYAVIQDIGASGAYFIAAATDDIYADPASLVGSIGVISQQFGYQQLLEKLGLDSRTFTAGEHKNFLSGAKPLNEKEVAHMQTLLDTIHQQFIDAVKQGRGERLADNPEIFSGLFWTGEQAKALGLIDGFASPSELKQQRFPNAEWVDYSPAGHPLEQALRNMGMEMGSGVGQGALKTLNSALGLEQQVHPVLSK